MGYVCPLFAPVRQVITVHDMLYRRHPEYLPAGKLAYWKLFVPLSAMRAKKVVAVSETTRQDVLECLHIPADKAVTIYSGVSLAVKATAAQISSVRLRYGLQGDYLLTVGCGKHKRVDLIERSLQEVAGLQLVVTGVPETGKIPANPPERVRYLGFVSSEDMPALYAGAAAYVTASEMEGFGFTVLEAMMAETPVICSSAGSLPEICGDAAQIVSTQDATAYAQAIGRVCFSREFREDMVAKGRMRVKEFPWRTSAEKHLSLYAGLAGLIN